MKIDKQQLAQLLKEAKQAHHEYQKNTIDTDDDWAVWYAEYIHNQLNNTSS